MSVSLVARREGVAASLLFQWRTLERQGALTALLPALKEGCMKASAMTLTQKT
jgi:transposase-like protein